ncbi:MAG: hypothetical protein WBK67_04110 [Minisyncoccales bacterium]
MIGSKTKFCSSENIFTEDFIEKELQLIDKAESKDVPEFTTACDDALMYFEEALKRIRALEYELAEMNKLCITIVKNFLHGG